MLPTFHSNNVDDSDGNEETKYVIRNGNYQVMNKKDDEEKSWKEWAVKRYQAMISHSGKKAREFLEQESVARATSKQRFLPDERTSMITDEESSKILQRSFEYIVALMEFNLVHLKFQFNHYFYHGFKEKLSKSFKREVVEKADWDKLVEKDPNLTRRLEDLKGKISGLEDSLHEVQRMQRNM